MKKVRVVVLLMAALFLFGTCATAAEPVALKWAVWDTHLVTYYEPLIEAFRAKNPHVTFELIDLGAADYHVVASTQLSGGVDFDVVTIKDIPGYANLVSQNHLEPLNCYIASAGVDTSLFGGITEQIAVDGEVYALPFRSDFWIIYYNKDLFDAAGVAYPTNDMTFAEYDAIARQVTRGSGAEKVYGAHYHTWRSASQLFAVLDGKNTVVDGTYDFLKPTYEMVLKQQDDGIVMDLATLRTTSTHYSGVWFNQQIAMMNMGTWFIPTQIAMLESGESLAKNWGIAKYPHPEGIPAGTTLGTITAASVARISNNKETAFDFVNFISGPEGAEIMANLGQFPAIMTDSVVDIIAAGEGFPEGDSNKEALKTHTVYLEMPLHERSAEIEIVLNEAHLEIMTGEMTIDEGIEEMNERVGQILGN